MRRIRSNARQRPTYLRMLAGILLVYVLIIGFGGTAVGDPLRVVVFGFLLWVAAQLRGLTAYRWWAAAASAVLVVATALATTLGSPRVAAAVVGLTTLVLTAVLIAAIAATVIRAGRIDTTTVLGVLCIYLLLALLFASIHQTLAAMSQGYLNGTSNPPTASDVLYFSVITMATVGFGDITPATGIARAVTVVEALTGQLYLVSVVAAVVGSWRGRRADPQA